MGNRIGYARVSRDGQNLDLQLDALAKTGVDTVYQEHASGATASGRPELAQCLKALRAGDTLVVWRLDRLGRSVADLVRIAQDLQTRGIDLVSVIEAIDTRTPGGRLMFHMFAAVAEFERNVIQERTAAGLASARARGRVGGRKPKLTAKDAREIKTLLTDPLASVADIAARYKVSRTTLYKSIAAA